MSGQRRDPVANLPDGCLQGWLNDARPGLVLNGEGRLELWVLLDVSVAASWGPEDFVMAVRPLGDADPYRFAAELTGAADAIVVQEGRKLQADRRVMAEHERRTRLEQRRIRAAMTEQALEASSCEADDCQRGVAVIVEGMRLCKRHAEELGVRPTGKVGGIGDEDYAAQAAEASTEELRRRMAELPHQAMEQRAAIVAELKRRAKEAE